MQSQRCVLCNVHGQPDKGFLVQSNQENLKLFHESLGKLDRHNEPDAQKIKHILHHVLHIGKTLQWSEYAASL